MLVSPSPTAGKAPPSVAAEAARYALLRRLAPSMRHHLVVNLQPIGMIYEVMERRLRAAQPDLAAVQESATKINGFARAALHSCIDVVSWLAPDDSMRTTVTEGARECASLLATSLSFRGYALRNEVPAIPGEVSRAAMRTLLTAALIHTTDHLQPPSKLVLQAEAHAAGVALRLDIHATEGDKGFTSEASYRPMSWEDLLALADAEEVAIERQDRSIVLRFPLLEAV